MNEIMPFNPMIVFLWSAIFYALSSNFIDGEGFLFVLGIICLGLGFFSTRYLYGITMLISGYIIYLTGIIGLFLSVIMVNNVDFIMNNNYLNHLVLGIGFACIILSGYRLVMDMRS